ncbi:MAG: hypothetical protein LBD44_06170 [Spirochaetaceae bacterium]|jgi:hypothetical protein|nr:hypothetical protein [Spirochaetaceae bacterium]
MIQEISSHTSGRTLGSRYYRLALGAAAVRDLSRAVQYAWYAALLDHENPNVVKLLQLCRDELGEAGGTGAFPEYADHRLERVRTLAAEKKWRDAARAARAIPNQSVRVLNIQGCLWALAKDYTKGSDCFALALGKDRSSRLAAEGLAELSAKRKRFWNILRGIL